MTNLLLDVQDTMKKERGKAQKLFDDGSSNVLLEVLEDIYKIDSFSGEVAKTI
jgi:hypothetical protein